MYPGVDQCEGCFYYETFCDATTEARKNRSCHMFVKRKKCENCEDSYRGYCRRYPPQRSEDENDNWAHPPTVEEVDWCGEFKLRKDDIQD